MSDSASMAVMDAVKAAWARFGVSDVLPPSNINTLLDFLRESASRFPDKPAVTCLGNSVTYAELDTLSSQFAAYLQQHSSLEVGDRLAIQMPSLSQYLVVAYGAFKAGMVVVNINPMYTEVELEYQFNHADVKAVVVFDRFFKRVQAVRDKTPLQEVYAVSPFDLHPGWKRVLMNFLMKLTGKASPVANAIPLLDVLAKGDASQCQPVTLEPQGMAVLQYTGGTTGVSKPAMISHHNLVSVTRQGTELLQLAGLKQGCEHFVSPLPLYHIYAFALGCCVGVNFGANTLLIPDPRDAKGFIKLLKKWPTSLFSGLNTLFVSLMKEPEFDHIDFSTFKMTLSGGSALASGTATEWQQRTGCEISEAYGLTEASPIVSCSPPGHGKLGSVGIAVPQTEIRIANEQGDALAVGEQGELWVRGPQVMLGYLDFPKETAETITQDGWLKTGDIASVDEDGYIRIHDRKKDMIIVSGFNVYPNEIESVVSNHPDVSYCAVIGVPDDHSGEAVKLYVVSKNPALTADQMRDYCDDQLARYKLPKFIEFRDELPLSNVGKVLRRALKEELEQATGN